MAIYRRDAGATNITTAVLTAAGTQSVVTSYGTADLLDSANAVLSSGISISESNGELTATVTIDTTIEPGFYRVRYNDVTTQESIEPFTVYSETISVTNTQEELQVGGWETRAGGTSRKRLYDSEYSKSFFEEKPKTFFFEKDGYMYTTASLNYKALIPVCDRYIFPSTYVWGANPTYSGLIEYFRSKAEVGVDIPVHSVNTSVGYGGFAEKLHNALSGLDAFPISTSGQYIYTDDYRVAWRFWEPSLLGVYNEIVSKYKHATNSGVDFLNYQSYEEMPTPLRNNPDDYPDYMLDIDKFGWYGAPPFPEWQWYNGLHKHVQSGVTPSDYVETRESWLSAYPTIPRLDEGAAVTIEGLPFEDDEWTAGEIWAYIQQINSLDREVMIAYTNERSCSELEAKLGKAIALCTDSYFSPGEANYSLAQNYENTLYTKYNLGTATSPPYKEGNTIKRSFAGGWVEIDDGGSLTSSTVRIYEGTRP